MSNMREKDKGRLRRGDWDAGPASSVRVHSFSCEGGPRLPSKLEIEALLREEVVPLDQINARKLDKFGTATKQKKILREID